MNGRTSGASREMTADDLVGEGAEEPGDLRPSIPPAPASAAGAAPANAPLMVSPTPESAEPTRP
jgi:hypothetical protein